jgi:hypothetical protein
MMWSRPGQPKSAGATPPAGGAAGASPGGAPSPVAAAPIRGPEGMQRGVRCGILGVGRAATVDIRQSVSGVSDMRTMCNG